MLTQYTSKASDDDKLPFIVVGSGMAGISAARELLAQGHRVHLIEARSKAGGRAQSYTTADGTKIPLGPMFIHGLDEGQGSVAGEKNPIIALTKQHGVTSKPVSFEDIEDSTILFPSEEIADEATSMAILQCFESYSKKISSKEASPVTLTTLTDTFAWMVAEESTVLAYEGVEMKKLRNTPLNDPMDGTFDGDTPDEFLTASGGYETLLQRMFTQLKQNPKFYCEFNTQASKIEHVEPYMLVTTHDGREIKGESVVCALPLGILQQKKVELPQLSPEKDTALDTMQIALQNKIILEFDEPFWCENPQEPDSGPDAIFFMLDQPDLPKFIPIINAHKFSDTHAPVLIVSFSGEDAKFSNYDSEQSLVQRLLSVLRKKYPDAPEPKNTQVSHWEADQHTLGAWSAPTNQTTPADLETLRSTDMDGRFILAGEYTAPGESMGSMHGAYISGARAAACLLDARLMAEHKSSPGV